MRETEDGIILWEAHRGGGGGIEMPESCMAGFEFGWMLGARPEADVNRTKDGIIVSVHDATLDRIVKNLPEEMKGKRIGELTYEQIRSCETGGEEFPGQHVPSLNELFERLRQSTAKQMILDYKNVDLKELAGLISEYGVEKQLTFASCNTDKCLEIKSLLPAIRIKVWIGGEKKAILEKFSSLAKEKFMGFEEIQLHLNDLPQRETSGWRYQLSEDDLRSALVATRSCGVLLQALPWQFEKEDIFRILSLEIRSFAVDYPVRFIKSCSEFFSTNRK